MFLPSSRSENPLSEDSPAAIPTIRIRIETLSDLVFGLALSIGSITLIEHIPQDAAGLINDVELFAFSFLIIVGIWLGYTRIIAVLPVETASTLSLNLGLLFCVALEPFFFYVFQTAPTPPTPPATPITPFLDFSSAAYALDTGSMMALLSGMMFLVLRQDAHRKVRRLRQVSIRNFRVTMVSQAIGSVLFIISASDVFLGPGSGLRLPEIPPVVCRSGNVLRKQGLLRIARKAYACRELLKGPISVVFDLRRRPLASADLADQVIPLAACPCASSALRSACSGTPSRTRPCLPR